MSIPLRTPWAHDEAFTVLPIAHIAESVPQKFPGVIAYLRRDGDAEEILAIDTINDVATANSPKSIEPRLSALRPTHIAFRLVTPRPDYANMMAELHGEAHRLKVRLKPTMG